MTPLLYDRIGALAYGLTEYALPVGLDTYALVSFTHDECALSTFCRNPLHPGPCKGWKRKLGLVAPGALHAIDRATIEKREARRKAKVESLIKAGQPVPKRLQKPIAYDPAANKHLQGPPDLTKDQAKQNAAQVPTANALRQKVDTRRAMAASPANVRAGTNELATILKDLGASPTAVQSQMQPLLQKIADLQADPKQMDLTAADLAQRLMNNLATKSGAAFGIDGPNVRHHLADEIKKKLSGDTSKTPVLDALRTGDKDATSTAAHHAELDAIAARGAAIKANRSAAAKKAAAARSAKKAAATPAKAPSAPAPSSSPTSKLTDQQLINGVKMHGSTSPQGKAAADELKKRGLDLDGKPITAPKPAATPPPPPSVPASPPAAPASTPPSGGKSLNAAQRLAASVANRNAPASRLAKTHADVYGKISKADFDGLPDGEKKKIESDLRAAHAKFVDQKKKDDVNATLARLTGKGVSDSGGSPTAPTTAPQKAAPSAPPPTPSAGAPSGSSGQQASPATHRPVATDPVFKAFQDSLDKLHSDNDPAVTYSAFNRHLSNPVMGPERKKMLEAFRHKVMSDTSQPLWLRAHMAASDGTKHPDSVQHAIAAATDPPSRSGRWYPTVPIIGDMMSITRDEQDKLPKLVRDALNARRNDAVEELVGKPLGDSRIRTLQAVGLQARTFGKVDRDGYDLLDLSAQRAVREGLKAHIRDLLTNGRHTQASEWQAIADVLEGRTYGPNVTQALERVRQSWLADSAHLESMKRVTKDEYKGLPDGHRMLLEARVQELKNSSIPDIARGARHVQADWVGFTPDGYGKDQKEAVYAARIDRIDDPDDYRATIYLGLSKYDINALDPSDRSAVLSDMKEISSGVGPTPPPLVQRFVLQRLYDQVVSTDYTIQQALAIESSHPLKQAQYAPSLRVGAYNDLSKKEHDELAPVFREAIAQGLEGLKFTHPSEYDAIRTKFDPSYQASPATPNVTQASPGAVKDVLDVVYGLDPKGKTSTRQLSVYGKLRKADYDRLQPQEQSTILGDLSYIATTSKVPTVKQRAETLMWHLSPPGTAPGQIPNQPIGVPSNAVSGQTRVPDPNGVAGSLKKAASSGQSGDGWFTSSNGRRVWGKYGAAGLLLRHVDSQSGEERFLMVQRGPGISDPGKWQFPGGAIDSKETFHEGAAREVIEELGFKDADLLPARVHGEHSSSIPGGWSYVSIAATIDKQLKPDLSTHHARMETADAKWMTRAEIAALDKQDVLLKPLAGGQLEQNVLSLFPARGAAAPGPVTKRPARLTGTPVPPAPVKPHKPSRGKNLVADNAAAQQLLKDVSAVRRNYRGKAADERLAAIGNMQGYDETPTVVSKAEMDRLLATGDYIEAWRGVQQGGGKTAAEINEEFRSGPAWYGTGVFGNGYYIATKKSVAQDYAGYGDPKAILRILIPKDAKIKSHESIVKAAKAAPSSKGGFSYVGRQNLGGGTLHDEGRMAAAMGLDGVEISSTSRMATGYGSATHVASPGKPAYNWVNRSVLIVQEA